jgi:plasmid stabilization system protein ParE
MRWVFHPEAAEDYLTASRYYTEIEASLGAAFVHSVEDAMEQISRHPLAWQPVEEDVRRFLLPRFPYGLYYTVEEDVLLVVSILHMKRLPGTWRSRIGAKDKDAPQDDQGTK